MESFNVVMAFPGFFAKSFPRFAPWLRKLLRDHAWLRSTSREWAQPLTTTTMARSSPACEQVAKSIKVPIA